MTLRDAESPVEGIATLSPATPGLLLFSLLSDAGLFVKSPSLEFSEDPVLCKAYFKCLDGLFDLIIDDFDFQSFPFLGNAGSSFYWVGERKKSGFSVSMEWVRLGLPGTFSLRPISSASLLAAWKSPTARTPGFGSCFAHHNLAVIQGIFVK